jgi:hypothetical protein
MQAQRCRGAAFIAILQYGLTGERDYDTEAESYQRDFIATSVHAWRSQWPQGLRVSQSDLPDRNPLGGATAAYSSGADEGTPDWSTAVHVPASLDPLNLRPPREVWRLAGGMDAPHLIRGWSKFFAADDFRVLSAYLVERRAETSTAQSVYRGDCSLTRDESTSPETKIKCLRTATAGVHLAARIGPEGKGRIEWLDLGPSGQLRDVAFEHAVPERAGYEYVLRANADTAEPGARLPDGRSLSRIELHWSASSEALSSVPAQIEITVIDDFALVRGAVSRLLVKRASVFDDAPLSRARLMRALYAELGMPPRAWCCVDAERMPPPQVEQAAVDPEAVAEPALQPFFRHCSACHLTREAFPPNFLSGTAQQVADRLRHCAPRMLVRLAAWHEAPVERVKTPMPPAAAVQGLGMSLSQWTQSAALAQMRKHLEALTRAQNRPVELKELLRDGYEALPACLPAQPIASQ